MAAATSRAKRANGNSKTVLRGVEANPGNTSTANAPATQSRINKTGNPHQSLAPMRRPRFTAAPDSLLEGAEGGAVGIWTCIQCGCEESTQEHRDTNPGHPHGNQTRM